MNQFYWLIKNSIKLDLIFLKTNLKIKEKIQFYMVKNKLIIKHTIKPFILGKNKCKLFGRDIYYDSRYGIAGLQRMMTTHKNLLDLSGFKDPKIIVDIGANVGFFSIFCEKTFPKVKKIYSIEPIPTTYTCLDKNFNNIKNVETFNIAISDYNGQAKMSFDASNSAISAFDEKGTEDVKVLKLDKFCEINNIKNIDLLKIDTEGFEAQVLKGGQGILAKTRFILLEANLGENINYSISQLMSLLYNKNFDFQLVSFRN